MSDEKVDGVHLDGFGFTGYRSFGGDLQYIGPLSKINIFIGANNSGKSNILRFCRSILLGAIQKEYFKTGAADTPRNFTGESQFAFCLSRELDVIAKFEERIRNHGGIEATRILDILLSNEIFCNGKSSYWFPLVRQKISPALIKSIQAQADSDGQGRIDRNHWIEFLLIGLELDKSRLSPKLQQYKQIPPTEEVFLKVLFDELMTHGRTFEVEIIPDARSLVPSKNSGNELIEFENSGLGLIPYLRMLQTPKADGDGKSHREKTLKFEGINNFVRAVLGNNTARLQIPDDETIQVGIEEEVFLLDYQGKGIEQLIILASVLTIIEGKVVCLEEPEAYLHPLLLKQLIEYIDKYTNNQYLITTHSSSILTHPGANVFHVRLDDKQYSVVERLDTSQAKAEALQLIGYLPSDLMLANYLIWVEGPSDRIYLNHWIKEINSGLTEGLHYTVMIYGGKLLSNFSAGEKEKVEKETDRQLEDVSLNPDTTPDDFIRMRALNRFTSIIMDRDRDNADDAVNETKQRMEREFNTDHGFAWVTEGREIENYIEGDTLEKAVQEIHGTEATLIDKQGPYSPRLQYKTGNKGKVITSGFKKKEIASAVVDLEKDKANLDTLDLREKVERLVAFIEKANGIG